jgi:small subunit ribosomal protein S1
MNEFEKMMEQAAEASHYSKNQKIKGKIVKITDDKVYVDVGQKVEAVLRKQEAESYKEGDEIEAVFIGKRDKDGYFILSRKGFAMKDKAKKLKEAFENRQKVKVMVVSKGEKGYIVDTEGIKGFMPFSESGTKRDETLPEGYTFEGYIVKFEERKGNPNVVISRKEALKEELNAEKEKYLSVLQQGQKVIGKVEKITDKVAVISIDNVVYGILPKSELSWDKNKKFEDVLKVGDNIELVIKEIKDKKSIFSLKVLEPNPWDKFDKDVEDVVEATVKEINKFGVIVDVDGVDGFIHNREISHFDYMKAKKNLKVGDKIKAKIIELDKENRKLKLSIKALQETPVEKFLKENPVGSVIEAKVKDVKQKVAFIDLGEIEGIVKLEDATDNKNIKSISSVLKEGKVYKFKVLGVEKDKILLGMKQLLEEEWNEFISKYKVGDIVKGKVKKLIEKGAIVDLGENIEGFIPVSEIALERINIPSDKLELHQEVEAKIIKIDPENKKITLSIKQILLEEEKKKKEEEKRKAEEETKRKFLEKFASKKEEGKQPEGEGLGTLGDILKKKLLEKG